jgi:hypothetical protein
MPAGSFLSSLAFSASRLSFDLHDRHRASMLWGISSPAVLQSPKL